MDYKKLVKWDYNVPNHQPDYILLSHIYIYNYGKSHFLMGKSPFLMYFFSVWFQRVFPCEFMPCLGLRAHPAFAARYSTSKFLAAPRCATRWASRHRTWFANWISRKNICLSLITYPLYKLLTVCELENGPVKIVDLPIEVIFPLVMLVYQRVSSICLSLVTYPILTKRYPTLPYLQYLPASLAACLAVCVSVCPFVYQCLSLGGCTIGATTKRYKKQSWTVNISETQNITKRFKGRGNTNP